MAYEVNPGRDVVPLFPRYAPGVTVFDNGDVARNPTAYRPAGAAKPTDEALAAAAAEALKREGDVPEGMFTTRVTNGVVTLEGRTECHYQRAAVERAIRFVDGVREVDNRILVQPTVAISDIRQCIAEALRRCADQAAAGIVLQSSGGTVDLRGVVRSRDERAAVESAVCAMPGVTAVNNHLIVGT